MKYDEYEDAAGRLWDLHEVWEEPGQDYPNYEAVLIGDPAAPDPHGTLVGPCSYKSELLKAIEENAAEWLAERAEVAAGVGR